MDKHEELFIKKTQEKIYQYFTYEEDEGKKIIYLESYLPQLLLLKNEEITIAISKYYIDQKILEKQIVEHQEGIQKLQIDYSNNINEIYEMIKKL